MEQQDSGVPSLPELRMVLLGARRVGKSSSGNTILGTSAFDVERGFEKCVQQKAMVAGRSVIVIDTPGWDKERAEDTPARIKDEILSSISLCAPGPSAFLLVIPVVEFSEQQRQVAENMLTIFGAALWRHTVVLLTWGELIQPGTVDEFLETQPPVKALVSKCGGRVCVLDNKACTDKPQTDELFQRVEELFEENCGIYFSMDPSYLYSKIKASRQQHESDMLKMREEFELKRAEQDQALENLKHLHEVKMTEMERAAEELRTSLEGKVTAKEGEIQELETLYEGKLKVKDQTLEELQSRTEKVMEEIEELKAQHKEMEAKFDELMQQCLKMTEDQALKESAIEQLEKDLKDYEMMLGDREKELAELKLRIDEQAKTKEEIARLEEEHERETNAFRSEVQELKAKCQELESQCEEDKRYLHQAKVSYEEQSVEIEKLEELCRDRLDKFQSLKSTQSKKDDEIRELKLRSDVVQQEKMKTERRLRETEGLLKEKENKLVELKQTYRRTLRHFRLQLEDMARSMKDTELETETDESKLLLGKRRGSKEFTPPAMPAESSRGSPRSHSKWHTCRAVKTDELQQE